MLRGKIEREGIRPFMVMRALGFLSLFTMVQMLEPSVLGATGWAGLRVINWKIALFLCGHLGLGLIVLALSHKAGTLVSSPWAEKWHARLANFNAVLAIFATLIWLIWHIGLRFTWGGPVIWGGQFLNLFDLIVLIPAMGASFIDGWNYE